MFNNATTRHRRSINSRDEGLNRDVLGDLHLKLGYGGVPLGAIVVLGTGPDTRPHFGRILNPKSNDTCVVSMPRAYWSKFRHRR